MLRSKLQARKNRSRAQSKGSSQRGGSGAHLAFACCDGVILLGLCNLGQVEVALTFRRCHLLSQLLLPHCPLVRCTIMATALSMCNLPCSTGAEIWVSRLKPMSCEMKCLVQRRFGRCLDSSGTRQFWNLAVLETKLISAHLQAASTCNGCTCMHAETERPVTNIPRYR